MDLKLAGEKALESLKDGHSLPQTSFSSSFKTEETKSKQLDFTEFAVALEPLTDEEKLQRRIEKKIREVEAKHDR